MQDNYRNEYIKRINQVIDYIFQHPEADLSLERLADIAAFSPYHFHRIFKSIVGETLNDYISMNRLARAAFLLVYRPAMLITDIALNCGYTSQATFARAFKQRFSVSASQYRKKHRLQDVAEETAEVTVKTLPSYHVAYVRTFGYNYEIERAWVRLSKWMEARELFTDDTTGIGVSYDDPDVIPVERCRYDACLTVPEGTAGNGEIGIINLPSGRYAQYHMESNYENLDADIHRAYEILYEKWLPSSGFQPGSGPCYNMEPNCKRTLYDKHFALDICMPVKPL